MQRINGTLVFLSTASNNEHLGNIQRLKNVQCLINDLFSSIPWMVKYQYCIYIATNQREVTKTIIYQLYNRDVYNYHKLYYLETLSYMNPFVLGVGNRNFTVLLVKNTYSKWESLLPKQFYWRVTRDKVENTQVM